MRFRLILHEGIVADELVAEVQAGIRRIYAALFGVQPEALAFETQEVPAGHFFTAGELSESSIVAGTVPAGTSREDRTRLMAEISELWCNVTGCTPNEIVVSAADAAP